MIWGFFHILRTKESTIGSGKAHSVALWLVPGFSLRFGIPMTTWFFFPRNPKDWMANHPANGRMIAFFWDLNSNQWIRFLWDVMSWFDSRSFERYMCSVPMFLAYIDTPLIWVYLVGGSTTDVFGKNQGSIATTQNMTIPQRWPTWSAFASGFPYLPNIVGYSYIYISISHDVSV